MTDRDRGTETAEADKATGTTAETGSAHPPAQASASPSVIATPAAPTDLPAIPLIDLGTRGPVALFERYRDEAMALLAKGRGGFPSLLVSILDRRSRRWLERVDRSFARDVAEIAAKSPRAGVWFLNASYEWGCTTAAIPLPGGGARLVRVMDWPLDGLGRHLVAARHTGHAGPWINLTWPGFVGCVQGSAPGRFAAAFNQAPLRVTVGIGPVDWLIDRRRVWRSRAELPAHLLRDVFDRCADFAEAKRQLERTELCLPAIFILAGADGGACVIERLEREAAVHEGPEAIANSWLAPHLQGRPRRDDNEQRRDRMRFPFTDKDHGFGWLAPPVLNDTTRLVMVADPAEGRLTAQGWEAAGAATMRTDLSSPASREAA